MELEKVSPKSTSWNSGIDEFVQQGLHREFFKYSKGMKLLVLLCVDKPVLPKWKKMHDYAYVVRICDDRDEFLGTTLVEICGEYSHVSWAYGICDRFSTKYGGSAFWYAILEGCYINEVYESTIENIGDTWTEKVQANNTTIVFELSTCSHNRKIEKGQFVSRMITEYDVVVSGSLFVCNVAVIIRWRGSGPSLAKGKIMLLYLSVLRITWDPGKVNFPMATTTCEYCWNGLIIFHGWPNFVFDRGKLDGCKISTLRTRLFQGVGIDRDLNVKVGLDFGPKTKV
jgi:hypothetical protein